MSAYPAAADSERHHQNFTQFLNLVRKSGEDWSESFSPTIKTSGFKVNRKSKNTSRVESAGNVDDDDGCGASFDSLIRHTVQANWQQIAKVCTHPCNKETFQMLQVKSEWNPNPRLSMCSMLETCLSAIIHMAVTCIDYGCRLYTSFLSEQIT